MRRALALTGVLVLLAGGTAACGSEDSGQPKASGKVTVSGKFGQAPKVTYDKTPVVFNDTETETLIEGKGRALEGQGAYLNVYIGNAYTGKRATSTWEEKQPLLVQPGKDTLQVFNDVLKDANVGDRVQVDADPKYAFNNQGNSQLYIGNKDSVVFVIDVMKPLLSKPTGRERPQPSNLPTPVEKGGKVTALDFKGVGQPSATLQRKYLIAGRGEKIKKGSQVALRYLGQVWKAKKPFDENYSADFPGIPDQSGSPAPVTIGAGGLIKGWDQGLVGIREGSRLLLSVPPELGYGESKQRPKAIKKNDTLVFVIDVLGVN